MSRNFSSSNLRFDEVKAVVEEAVKASSATLSTNSSASSATEATASAASSGTSEKEELVLDFLPEKPTPLASSGEDVSQLIVGDPPFEALGLASWWPPGRVQYLMECIHNGLDIPWWGTIMISKKVKYLACEMSDGYRIHSG